MISDKVMVLERGSDGKHACTDALSMAQLNNHVPGYGDRISLLLDQGGLLLREVVGRYFLEYHEEGTGHTVWTWFLVVKEIEPDFDLDDTLMEVYEEHFRWRFGYATSPAPIETAETLDRSNRDPAYWTFERKEILRKEREARLAAMGKDNDPR